MFLKNTFFRLVVASHIGQNVDSTTITLRNTTLMPNIHGFAALVSLIFCPIMETKPLPDGSRFASILCGLGAYETTTKALYPPHDFVLNLDTELTSDELARVEKFFCFCVDVTLIYFIFIFLDKRFAKLDERDYGNHVGVV